MKLFTVFFLVAAFINHALSSPATPLRLPRNEKTYPIAVDTSKSISNIGDIVTPVQKTVIVNGNVTIEIFNNTTQMCCNQQNGTETQPPPKLPDGYLPISENDGYITGIKLYSTKQIFNVARKTCFHERAYLAYATTKEEEDVYLKIMDDNKIIDIWTGIHDLYEQFDWSTIRSEVATEAAYFNWWPGQPDNAGGDERCTHFRKEGLNDIPCCSKFPFICKIKLPLSLKQ